MTSQINVGVDAYHVCKDASFLICDLNAAVAVCVHDDTQGVGGMLHLRFIVSSVTKPQDLTDNTLSSDLLLLDRFCKELRAEGARKQSWRVRLISHVPTTDGMHIPAATLFDLLKAYFADSRLPVESKEIRRSGVVQLRFDSREGQVSLHALEAPR